MSDNKEEYKVAVTTKFNSQELVIERMVTVRADTVDEAETLYRSLMQRINNGEWDSFKRPCTYCGQPTVWRSGVRDDGRAWAGWFCAKKSEGGCGQVEWQSPASTTKK